MSRKQNRGDGLENGMKTNTNWTEAQRREVTERMARNDRRSAIAYWMGRDISDAVTSAVRLYATVNNYSFEEIRRASKLAEELVAEAVRGIEYSDDQYGNRLKVRWANEVNECRKEFAAPDQKGSDQDYGFKVAMTELFEAATSHPIRFALELAQAKSKRDLKLDLLDENLLADFNEVPAIAADDTLAMAGD